MHKNGKFSAISTKGDNLWNILFVFLYLKPLLESGLREKERISPVGANSFLLGWSPIDKGCKNTFDTVAALVSISIPEKKQRN